MELKRSECFCKKTLTSSCLLDVFSSLAYGLLLSVMYGFPTKIVYLQGKECYSGSLFWCNTVLQQSYFDSRHDYSLGKARHCRFSWRKWLFLHLTVHYCNGYLIKQKHAIQTIRLLLRDFHLGPNSSVQYQNPPKGSLMYWLSGSRTYSRHRLYGGLTSHLNSAYRLVSHVC